MRKKYLVPVMPVRKGKTGGRDAVELAAFYSDNGADAILLFDLSESDEEHEQNISMLRELVRRVEIPVYAGGHIRRVEDAKKILYAGCHKAVLNCGRASNVEMLEEVSKRFGRDKIAFSISDESQYAANFPEFGSLAFWSGSDDYCPFGGRLPVISVSGAATEEAVIDVLSNKWADGISTAYFSSEVADFMGLKATAAERGLKMHVLTSEMEWEELRPNSDGLVPVVVQDYRTLEVLMVAYMNEEAFDATIETGKMTYWSRSRQELWVKGMTSGHFQYIKALSIDCDNDTLLAKVSQVGAACHTGNYSCFYRDILKKEYDTSNPLRVFKEVYDVIKDRKANPKEGSYTNYLFDKGLDKILKKVGEEATELVIAAKNPDPEEIKYEMSDLLYHAMVLMVERGVTWEDITEELAKR
ncbi:MAG: bifunctional phosphoribosyl-AMP cyclohydrolase/phosphoribosyl-ATP diphosphatase HisIE [Lachnospiraceae bacterium]|nr:bifunctional phosphoribosyl-AMP cyclohydrolase/phosphoribosyl-ATP diphosphatase HisIE [Lachnospiraceae bacterium]